MKLLLLLFFLISCGGMSERERRKRPVCPEGERYSWKDKACVAKKVSAVAVGYPVII